jgi:hypothetical protein
MTAPLTVRLEVLERAHAALEAVNNVRVGDPIPLKVALQVAEAVGHARAAMDHIGRTQVEVIEA